MNNTALTLCLTAAIMAGLATHSVAASDTRGGPKINFDEVDANSDGLMSPEELQAHRAARFAATDTDGSGALSRDEIAARMQSRSAERQAKFLDRMFEKRDANADGRITLEEMLAGRSAKMFERADTDGDGMISRAEFDAAREAGKAAKRAAQ